MNSKLDGLKEVHPSIYNITYTKGITIPTTTENIFSQDPDPSYVQKRWKKRYFTSGDICCLLISRRLIFN